MLTKEQYEKLLPYEHHFFTAINGDYARSVTTEGFQIINSVYKEIYGRDSGLVTGCNRCRLRGLKEIGKLFYEYKDAEVGNELEPKEEVVENKEVKKPKAKSATNKKNGGGK